MRRRKDKEEKSFLIDFLKQVSWMSRWGKKDSQFLNPTTLQLLKHEALLHYIQ